MKKASLAEAKAHLSKLVDDAEHRKKRTLILRHGKPAAAIVPVDVVSPKRPRKKPLSDQQVRRSIRSFVQEFSRADPGTSAVDDLLKGRR